MPEELVLGLVVLGVVGVIVYGIARVIVEASRSTNKEVGGLLGKLHSHRIQKKKTALKSQVYIFLPEPLEKAAQTLKNFEADLSLRRKAPMRTASPPSWNKIDFQPHKLAVQSSAARGMNIADVALILRKDLEAWHEQEKRILARDCSYPADPPSSSPLLDLQPIVIPEIRLDAAVFEIKTEGTRSKDVYRYFAKERQEVESFNKKRSSLLSLYQELARSAKELNKQELEQWTRYRDLHFKLETEEVAKFQNSVRAYAAACAAEKPGIWKP